MKLRRFLASVLAFLLLSGGLALSHVCAQDEPCCKEVQVKVEPSCHEGAAAEKVPANGCCDNCAFQADLSSKYLSVAAVQLPNVLTWRPASARSSDLHQPQFVALNADRQHPPPVSYSYTASAPSFGRSPPQA